MSTRRTLATVVVAAALSLGAAAPASAVLIPDPGRPTAPGAQAPRPTATPLPTATPTELRDVVEVEGVLDHLEAFEAIADTHDGTRAAGTDGHEAAAAYVEARLRSAGYETWRHSFPFTFEETRSSSLTLTVDQTTTAAAHVPMAQSPGTDGVVTGALAVPSGSATGCEVEDWGDGTATGRIALVDRGACTFADKARAARDAGAVALLVANTTTGALVGTLGGRPDDHLPTVGVTGETGEALRRLPASATLALSLDKVVEERETFTVLAERRGARSDGVVMLGAHLDGTDSGPGLNDNGTGSAVLLETAVRLASTRETPRTVRFAWWGASHLGNLGSRSYVADLAAEDPEAVRRIGLYLDVDAVGSPNHIIGVQDPGGAGSVLADHLDSRGQAWVRTTPPADSDALAFLERGIPSTGLSTGTSGSKSIEEREVFGGTAGLPYDPNHDTVADDLANVDTDVLRTTTAAVAHATQTLASRR